MHPPKTEHLDATIIASSYIPMRVIEIELAEVLPPLITINEQTGKRYQDIHCLIRLHSQPLGMVTLNCDDLVLSPDHYVNHIWNTLHQQINDHLAADHMSPLAELPIAGLPWSTPPACVVAREQFLATAPLVSVIVATHNRLDRLASCLQALLTLRYPNYEIIVVDNAPTMTGTFELIQQLQQHTPHLHYQREDRQGLSWARNSGILAAKGEILAFTDDDVRVDSLWLVELVRGFQSSEKVACVTGLVLPLELETLAQAQFEQYGGFSKGFTRNLFNLYEHHPQTRIFPYSAGIFGTGANIAFDAAFLHHIGGFDPALGAGSRAQGGEDLAVFFQVIMEGYTLVYEPSALIYHQHRRDDAALQKQIYHYGSGLTAYLMKNIVDNPIRIIDMLGKIPSGIYFLLKAKLSVESKHNSFVTREKSLKYPKKMLWLEIKGMFYGPLAYLQGRWSSQLKNHLSVRSVLRSEKRRVASDAK